MKRMSSQTLILFLALAGSMGTAQRHQPPDPGQMMQRRINFLTEALGLSAAQQQQANEIFTNTAANAKSLEDQMKTAHENLQAAIARNDSTGIDQAANSIGNLMAQSISAHAKADAAFYQTLTPDQQSKYSQMHSREGGFGMPLREGPHPF